MAEFTSFNWESASLDSKTLEALCGTSANLIINSLALDVGSEVTRLASDSGMKASILRGAISDSLHKKNRL